MAPDSAGAPLRRGQIYCIDWEPARGEEQHGRRPGLIVQADPINASSTYGNTIIVAITTADHAVPTHVALSPTPENGLNQRSFAMCEHLITVARGRLRACTGSVDAATMGQVDRALKRALGLK